MYRLSDLLNFSISCSCCVVSLVAFWLFVGLCSLISRIWEDLESRPRDQAGWLWASFRWCDLCERSVMLDLVVFSMIRSLTLSRSSIKSYVPHLIPRNLLVINHQDLVLCNAASWYAIDLITGLVIFLSWSIIGPYFELIIWGCSSGRIDPEHTAQKCPYPHPSLRRQITHPLPSIT